MMLLDGTTRLIASLLAADPVGAAAPVTGAAPAVPAPAAATAPAHTAMDLFHSYLPILTIAFVVTLLTTPLMRKLAIRHGVIDRPSEARKVHRVPIAYLGGVAVFLGILAGVAASYAGIGGIDDHYSGAPSSAPEFAMVPVSVLVGMLLITLTGLIDDVTGLDPRLKISGQLLAAAALAMEDVGTKVAAQVLKPTLGAWLGNEQLQYAIHLPFSIPLQNPPTNVLVIDIIYWVGVAIIALFVLGACNASNLIDGLDGLLSGVTAISVSGLLIIALGLAAADDGLVRGVANLDGARIVMCMAVIGACLGFLPHNFNPATIFLGDTGSLLLGYMTIVIVLMLGDTGKTDLVLAGLIVYAIPIIDTTLAIVRRKMAGKSIGSADDQHLHHQLKRALGVKGAVLALYGIGIVFAILGVWLTMARLRVVLTISLMFAAFIGVTAVKIARRAALEAEAVALHGAKPAAGGPPPKPVSAAPEAKEVRPALSEPTVAKT